MYYVPGSMPVPQNPMNVMVMVMVKLILNATPLNATSPCPSPPPSSSPLPPYVFPSLSYPRPPPPPLPASPLDLMSKYGIMSSSSMLHLGHDGSTNHEWWEHWEVPRGWKRKMKLNKGKTKRSIMSSFNNSETSSCRGK